MNLFFLPAKGSADKSILLCNEFGQELCRYYGHSDAVRDLTILSSCPGGDFCSVGNDGYRVVFYL